MPKMIDPELKARAVRLVTEHVSEYPSLTAAAAAGVYQGSWTGPLERRGCAHVIESSAV